MYKKVLTDARKHNPNNFVYIVHALHNYHLKDRKSIGVENKLQSIVTPGYFLRASLVGKMDKIVAEKTFGVSREIDQTGTFFDFGFIIVPADDNLIKIAWTSDLGSPHEQKTLVNWVNNNKGKIKKPILLLTETIDFGDGVKYNELIIEGHENNKIAGVFYNLSSQNSECKAREVNSYLKSIGIDVPIVEIGSPRTQVDDNPKKKQLEKLRVQAAILASHLEFANFFKDEARMLVPVFHQEIKKSRSDKSTLVKIVARNDPCPCDSGKKYKHCHGS